MNPVYCISSQACAPQRRSPDADGTTETNFGRHRDILRPRRNRELPIHEFTREDLLGSRRFRISETDRGVIARRVTVGRVVHLKGDHRSRPEPQRGTSGKTNHVRARDAPSEREPQVRVQRVVVTRVATERNVVRRGRAVEFVVGSELQADARILPRVVIQFSDQS